MKRPARWNAHHRLLAPLLVVASALAGGVRDPDVPLRLCVAEQQASRRPERLAAMWTLPATPRRE
jgi:hypothetical protein